eukprot:15408447-Alexandrium_andersonii.AAC.1
MAVLHTVISRISTCRTVFATTIPHLARSPHSQSDPEVDAAEDESEELDSVSLPSSLSDEATSNPERSRPLTSAKARQSATV